MTHFTLSIAILIACICSSSTVVAQAKTTPFLDDTMKRVTMMVMVGGQEEPVVFDLNVLM